MQINQIDQSVRRIVCLANSRKTEGRCVAGKVYAEGKIGSWVRPISNRDGEELSEAERQISNGVEPALLDILEFAISAHKPSPHQPENFLINPQYKFKRVGSLNIDEIFKVADKPTNLWVMGYQSKTFGINDLVPPDRISEVKNSLYLINPHTFAIQVVKGFNKLEIRGLFTYLGAEYNLKITDPVVEENFIPKGVGEYKVEDVLLTISLAEKLFMVSSNPSSSGYYKLIAGVIDISLLGRK
jgi:hypothetical protein